MAVQHSGRRRGALLALGVLGAFSQLAQALLARELLVAFYGNEISLGAMYGCWLGWIALGAGMVAWRRGWWRGAGLRALRACLLALPLALAAQLALVRAARVLLGIPGIELAGLGALLGVTALATAPTGLLTGMAFPLACQAVGQGSGSAPGSPRADTDGGEGGVGIIAALYTTEALGALGGGLLFTALLLAGLGTWRTACLGAAVAAVAVWSLPARGRGSAVAAAVLGLTGGLMALTPAGVAVERYAERARFERLHPGMELLEAFDSRYGHLALGRIGSQRTVLLDGRVADSFPDPHAVAQRAAFYQAQAAGARRVLLVGSVASGLASELLRYPIERLDVVQQDRRAFERLRPHLDPATAAVLHDQRARLHFGDARRFVRRASSRRASGEGWDLVVLDLPDPSSAQLNRFYTVELYRLLHARMNADGVLCTAVTGASGYFGREISGYSGSLFRTLSAVFAHLAVAPGERHTFCASSAAGRVSEDAEQLTSRYRAMDVRGRSFPPGAFATLLPAARVAALHQALARAGGEINRDGRPVSYFLNMVLWTRFSSPKLVEPLYALRRMGVGTWLAPLLILALLLALRDGVERRPRVVGRRVAARFTIFCTGLVAMALQLTLLLAYQARVGAIFERIALLNGLFMTGLALGAGLLGRRLSRGRAAGRVLLWALAFIAAGSALLPALLWRLQAVEGTALELCFAALVCSLGVSTGTVFPLGVQLSHDRRREVGQTAGFAEAADHLGGALGGLLAGAVWVPLLGLAGSTRLLALAALAAMIPLAVALRPERTAGRLARALMARGYRSFPFGRLSWALAWLLLVTWVVASLAQSATGPQVRFGVAELQAVSGSRAFELVQRPMPHYRGSGGAVAPRRTVSLASMPVAAQVRGYAGPLNLLVSVDDHGVLRGVRYLSSDETPAYIYGIEDWLAKLPGRDLSAAPLDSDNVDVISGASISSAAALETINRAAHAGASTAFALELPVAHASGRARPPPWATAKPWVVLLLLVLAVPAFLSGREWPRLGHQVAVLLVLGVWLNALLTEVDAANLSRAKLPALSSNPAWYLLVGFAVSSSLLWGQIYCGFVCPFGALQELVSRLGRALGLRAYAGRYLEMRMRYAKYVLLVLAMVAFWTSGELVWVAFNPMQHIFGLHFGGWMGLLICASLLGALRYYRFWCRYFCPLGALLALGNKLALWRRSAPQRSLLHCDLGVRDELDVDCIQCNRCITRIDLGVRRRR